MEEGEEITVDEFHEVGALLVALINAVFERHSLLRVDFRVADEVFHVPLSGINPAFAIEVVLDGLRRKGVGHCRIDTIGFVIIAHNLFKDRPCFFGESHINALLVFAQRYCFSWKIRIVWQKGVAKSAGKCPKTRVFPYCVSWRNKEAS